MQQGSKEWLEFRRSKIGASDAATIMKCSPWSTPLKLWRQKMGIEPETALTPAMRRGMELEEQARQCFIAKTGIAMAPDVLVSQERPWQMASLDGISQNRDAILEVKCPNKDTHEMAKQNKLPDHYMIQMQHQLCVAGVNIGYYFSYDGSDGVVVEVKRDTNLIGEIVYAERDFWRRLQEFDPPESSQRNDVAWREHADRFREASEAVKTWEAIAKKEREALIALSGSQSAEGAGIKLVKSMCKGLIDYNRIPELKNVDLEAFRKPSYEKFTLTY